MEVALSTSTAHVSAQFLVRWDRDLEYTFWKGKTCQFCSYIVTWVKLKYDKQLHKLFSSRHHGIKYTLVIASWEFLCECLNQLGAMHVETSLDVWNINSDWTDRCRTLLVKATGISSFCCTSMVHVLTISHDRDQGIMLKQWISSQIWLDISLIGQTYNTIDQNCNWYLFTRHA